jgi:multidrug efflux pump subunit AcrA (membrane-fusion protein)
VAQLRGQLEANRLELQNLSRDEAQVKADIEQYQKRLNLTPVREQQLAGLQRDYDLLKADYTDLLGKETQSQLAGSLEKRQDGQQFRLIDSPSLPVAPSFPKPLPIGLGGLAVGIGLGLALAFFIDMKDGVFYSEEDLLRYMKPPLVVAIPVLRTPSEEGARTWFKVLEWAAGSSVLLIVFAAEFYELYLKRNG